MTLETGGPAASSALQPDIARHVCSLLPANALRGVSEASREWRQFAEAAVRELRPNFARPNKDLADLANKYPGLRSLDLKLYAVSGAPVKLEQLAGFRHLSHLALDGSRVGNSELCDLAAAAVPLASLSLRNCTQVTWSGLQKLEAMPSLTALNVAGVKISPDDTKLAGLQALFCKLESLTVGDGLALSFVHDGLMLALAAARPPALAALDLSGCIDLTDTAIQSVARLTTLKRLSLQSCVRLTNSAAVMLAGLTGLRHLSLRGCLQLTDAGVSCLSTLTALQELNLQGCTHITGSCFLSLAPCSALSTLNVSHCASLASLEPLRSLPRLTRLSVSSCAKLTLPQLSALTALAELQHLQASHLRSPQQQQQLPGAQPAAQAQAQQAAADEQLASLASLTGLASLDLSHFAHPAGLPAALLHAVASMTSLERLRLAGSGQRGGGGVPGAAPSTAPTGAAIMADRASSPTATASEGLGFLRGLTRLEELDLGGWQEADPSDLACLAGATRMRKLNISRLGNLHRHACFDGCDCCGGESAAPSTCLSASSSAPSSAPGSPAAGRNGHHHHHLHPHLHYQQQQQQGRGHHQLPPHHHHPRAQPHHVVGGPDAAVTREETTCSSGPSPSAACFYGAPVGGASPGMLNSIQRLQDRLAAVGIATTSAPPALPMSARRASDGGGGPLGMAAACSSPHDDAHGMGALGSSPSLSSSSCGEGGSGSGLSSLSSSQPGSSSTSASSSSGSGSEEGEANNKTFALPGGAAAGACGGAGTSAVREAFVTAAEAAAALGPGVSPASLRLSLYGLHTAELVLPGGQLQLQPSERRGAAGGKPASSSSLDNALAQLAGMQQLAELKLEACSLLTDAGVAHLAALPRLELLDLGGCGKVTGVTIGALAGRGALKTLSLVDCGSVNDTGLQALARVASLQALDLGGCVKVSDAGAVRLAALQGLTRLVLRGNSKISGRTVEVLASMPRLRSLSLALCSSVTDPALAALRAAPCLVWLDLHHCWRLNRAAIATLEAARPQTSVLFTGKQLTPAA